jgi:hypothetical protein
MVSGLADGRVYECRIYSSSTYTLVGAKGRSCEDWWRDDKRINSGPVGLSVC